MKFFNALVIAICIALGAPLTAFAACPSNYIEVAWNFIKNDCRGTPPEPTFCMSSQYKGYMNAYCEEDGCVELNYGLLNSCWPGKCLMCDIGYVYSWYDSDGDDMDDTFNCIPCPAGTYYAYDGEDDYHKYNGHCEPLADGEYGTGCHECLTVSYNYACTGKAECGVGYYCSGGFRTKCPDSRMTTKNANASSVADCVCPDGYWRDGDKCIEGTTPICSAGGTELHVGEMTFQMYQSCNSPALWLGMPGGICCVNLSSGPADNALNIQYNKAHYHTVN